MTDARSAWYCIMWSNGLRHWPQNWDFWRFKCVVLYHVVECFKTLVSEMGLLEVQMRGIVSCGRVV